MKNNGFRSFRPPRWLSGPHLQTLGGAVLAAPRLPRAGTTESLELEVEAGERLLLLRDRVKKCTRGRLLLLHGLGGAANSRNLLHFVDAALRRGWETLRLNARGAGAGIHLSRRIPHAGRWADVAATLAAEPWSAEAATTPCIAIGLSLGGSILLNHLGLTGEASGLAGAVAINPPTDLACTIESLERPGNAIYHTFYTVRLRRALHKRARMYPECFSRPTLMGLRSVRAIDEAYVAADAGFDCADAYYAACSARRCAAGIRTPTWVVSSRDDPFVPYAMLERDLGGVPAVHLWPQPAGGHLGYIEMRDGRPAFWAAEAALAVASHLAGLAPVGGDDLVDSEINSDLPETRDR